MKILMSIVGADEQGGILLYVNSEEKDTEILLFYDVLNNKERVISDFKKSRCVQDNYGGHRHCVGIDTVTRKKQQ